MNIVIFGHGVSVNILVVVTGPGYTCIDASFLAILGEIV